MIINKLTFLKATTITRTRITKEEKRKKISSPILPDGGSSPITRLPISRKRHTTIDKSKRTASTADLQGYCNLRQNSVSSASSYRVICVRLRGNLHQVTTQSASSYNAICVKLQSNLQLIKNKEAAGDTTTRNGIKQGRPLTGNLNISREASARYQRRKADK